MVTEKYDREIDRIDEKIKELNQKKKDVLSKREDAVKTEVFGIFEKKKVPPEKLLALSMLSKKEIETMLSNAEKEADDGKEEGKDGNDEDHRFIKEGEEAPDNKDHSIPVGAHLGSDA